MPARGLYVLTDPELTARAGVVRAVTSVIAGGAAAVQYRNKDGDEHARMEEAASLLALCREHGVPLIVNDDVALAATIGADGVHVGRDDADLRSARHALGERAIVGVSCYDSEHRADEAEHDGADYVAFGSFFPSRTKPRAVSAHPSLLAKSRRVPVVAIGGITADNAPGLLSAGAGLLAVAHGVLGQPDPEAAARAFARVFESSTLHRGSR